MRHLISQPAGLVTALLIAGLGPPPGTHPVDYAPSGMPDFSQCRGPWSRAGSPGQWTHAGPVAAAGALWWLDSVNEPGDTPPPTVADGFALVTAYPIFGPAYDDHDSSNIRPLVEDLARRANTEGAALRDETRGTRWEDLVAGLEGYVRGRTGGAWVVEARPGWDSSWVESIISDEGAVVALLGVWQAGADDRIRVGGHYAAVVEAGRGVVVLADPLADRGDGLGGALVPADPAFHSCREAPAAHDDAAVVSHDAYLLADAALPAGHPVLQGYFRADTQGEAAAFAGQNPAGFLSAYSGDWTGAQVVMALDAAVAIAPRTLSTATATAMPTPSITHEPAATPTAAPVTASATATGGSSATPTDEPTPTASQHATPRLYLPLVVGR